MSSYDPAELPDSGMDSGSDAGEPSRHLDPRDLGPDERRLLEALERDVTDPDTDPPAGSDAMAEAADDDAPLPAEGGPPDDGLTARFTAPEQG